MCCCCIKCRVKIWTDGLACHCVTVQDNENESSDVPCLYFWSRQKIDVEIVKIWSLTCRWSGLCSVRDLLQLILKHCYNDPCCHYVASSLQLLSFWVDLDVNGNFVHTLLCVDTVLGMKRNGQKGFLYRNLLNENTFTLIYDNILGYSQSIVQPIAPSTVKYILSQVLLQLWIYWLFFDMFITISGISSAQISYLEGLCTVDLHICM